LRGTNCISADFVVGGRLPSWTTFQLEQVCRECRMSPRECLIYVGIHVWRRRREPLQPCSGRALSIRKEFIGAGGSCSKRSSRSISIVIQGRSFGGTKSLAEPGGWEGMEQRTDVDSVSLRQVSARVFMHRGQEWVRRMERTRHSETREASKQGRHEMPTV
jgi:hypothetical protein